jgi:uncharacterized protein (TIGR00369 family)
MISRVEVERFSLTSSRSFDEVLAAINDAVGNPEMAEFWSSTQQARTVGELENTDVAKHANPMGTLHGGVLCDVADAAIGTAHATGLVEGESFTSLDLQINFFRPVWNDRLRAIAKPVHLGKTVSRYVCEILNSDGKLVAQVTSTLITLRGEKASGR